MAPVTQAIPSRSRGLASARRLADAGRWADAEHALAPLLARAPDDAAALELLGDVLLSAGHPARAAEAFAIVAARRPTDPTLLYRLAIAHQRAYRYAAAAPVFHRLTQLTPEDPHAWTGLAWCLASTGAAPVAVSVAARAEALAPEDRRVRHTVAACCLAAGDTDGAARRYRDLLASDAEDDVAAWGLASLAFGRGDFASAWPLAEHRHVEMRQRGAYRPLPAPAWRGESLDGGTLLVVHEQGAGDLLQFARFLSLAAARGTRVVVEAPPGLHGILATVPGVTALVQPRAAVPDVRAAVHLMSLPHALGTGNDLLGAAVPYLSLPGDCPEPIAASVGERDATDGRPRIGLVWAGAAGHANDHQRSMPLEALRPLWASVDAQWISLQVGPRSAELQRLPPTERDGILDAAPWLTSYAATAHLVARLDLVVAVDTSVAHLAGALRRPTWILLPHVADWRWTGTGTATGWYPSARLFRQPAPGDWPAVVRDVVGALRDA